MLKYTKTVETTVEQPLESREAIEDYVRDVLGDYAFDFRSYQMIINTIISETAPNDVYPPFAKQRLKVLRDSVETVLRSPLFENAGYK